MAVAQNDVVRVVANMLINSTDLQNNVYHTMLTSASIDDDEALEDVAEWLDDAYAAALSVIVNNLTFDDIRAINESAGTDVGTSLWPTLTAGSATGEMLPLGASALIRFLTGVLGREGKKYFPVTGEGSLSDGIWNANYLSVLSDFADLIIAPFTSTNGNTWQFVVWSPTLSQALAVTDYVLSAIPAYQRRRRQNRGA